MDPDSITHSVRSSSPLRASVLDAMWFSVMLGCAESYLTAYAIFLGGSVLQVGLVATLPPLIGALIQLLGVKMMQHIPNRRKLIALGAKIQAVMWIPIALLEFFAGQSESTVWILIGFVILYHGAGNVITPVWNSLIGDMVPAEVRGRFFGYRNLQAGWVTLLSLGGGGVILYVSRLYGLEQYGFLLCFSIGAASRVISSHYLNRYADIPYVEQPEDRFSFFDFVKRTPHSNFAKFVFFVGAFNFAAHIAAPYFSVYMLREAKMSYIQFTIASAIPLLFQFLTMQYWGRLSDQFGNRIIMIASANCIVLLPLPWLLSSEPWMIYTVQSLGGLFWAGFNLATFSFLFDAVTPSKRARCVAYMGIISTGLTCCGALVGSWLETVTASAIVPHLHDIASPLLNVMVFSTAMRGAMVLLFHKTFREVRSVDAISQQHLLFRLGGHMMSYQGLTVITGVFKKRVFPKKSTLPPNADTNQQS